MDVTQFKQCFLPFSSQLYSIAFRLTHNVQRSEDLVQETYLRLWTQRNSLDKVEHPLTYTIGILRHLFMDQLRSNKMIMTQSPVEDYPLSTETDLPRSIDATNQYKRLINIITHLPDPQGKIMMMRDIEDRSYTDISDELGLSEVNIRSILSRSRKRVRQILGENNTLIKNS